MPIYKSTPIKKTNNNTIFEISEVAIVVNTDYTTSGENAIIVKGSEDITIFLDSKTTNHITIKSMCNVLVIGDRLIDEEFNEIKLERTSSVELLFANEFWYIMGSDGIKNS